MHKQGISNQYAQVGGAITENIQQLGGKGTLLTIERQNAFGLKSEPSATGTP